MFNYIAKFVENASNMTVHLRKLIEDKSDWNFSYEHQQELENMKVYLSTHLLLQYYDPTKPAKITSDASKYGLGAVLQQLVENQWRPVSYASRSLSECEINYAQIEKECLALQFGICRFHQYIYGRAFVAETDHMPLVTIFKKALCDTPPRLQRMILKLQPYDFSLEFVKGKHNIVADTLSRAFIDNNGVESSDYEMEQVVHELVVRYPISECRMKQFQPETATDNQLQQLRTCIMENQQPTGSIGVFKGIIGEISYMNNLLWRNNRIIVPQSA